MVSYIKAPSGGMWILTPVASPALAGTLDVCPCVTLVLQAGPGGGEVPSTIPRAARAGPALPHREHPRQPRGSCSEGRSDEAVDSLFKQQSPAERGSGALIHPGPAQQSRVAPGHAPAPVTLSLSRHLEPFTFTSPQAQPPHSSSERKQKLFLGTERLLVNSRNSKQTQNVPGP